MESLWTSPRVDSLHNYQQAPRTRQHAESSLHGLRQSSFVADGGDVMIGEEVIQNSPGTSAEIKGRIVKQQVAM